MTPAEVADWTTASRRAQGLPDRIDDPRGVPDVGQLSCRVVVFMDQTAKDVTAAELSCDQRLRLAIALRSLGRRQAEAAVRTAAVTVPDVAVEDAKQLPTAGDQEMVQALPAHGANPAPRRRWRWAPGSVCG
jgi:hypothetical protein